MPVSVIFSTRWIMTSLVWIHPVAKDVCARMESSTCQPVMTDTTALCLLPVLKIAVIWKENGTVTSKYLLWTSAINVSASMVKYRDAHEESARVVMMTHLVISVKSHTENQSVVPMV